MMKEINVKDDSLFYCDIEPNKLTNGFVSKLREYCRKIIGEFRLSL